MPYCAIAGCGSGHLQKEKVRKYQLFRLPASKDMKERWLEKIKINRPHFDESIHTSVCAKHFRISDYIYETENVTSRGILMKNRKLKSTAIPSLHLNGAVI